MDLIDRLERIGQYVWIDDGSLDGLDEQAIVRCRDEQGVTGVSITLHRDRSAGSRHVAADGGVGDQALIARVRRAADVFADIHARTKGATGWVCVGIPADVAHDEAGTLVEARDLHRRVDRSNVMVGLPGTDAGIAALQELVALGVPVNVTLLYGGDQWRAAHSAYIGALERRARGRRSLTVGSVASIHLSDLDRRLDGSLPAELRHQMAILSAQLIDHEWRSQLRSAGWRRLAERGAEPQRLLWMGLTPDGLDEMHYVRRLGAPDTIVGLQSAMLDAACCSDGELVRLDHLDPFEGHALLERIETACGARLADIADELQRSQFPVCRADPAGRARLDREGSSAS